MRRVLHRLRGERGIALVTAMVVTMLMLALALGVAATVDVQGHASAHERVGEGAFDLAQAALDSEIAQLARSWPSTTGTALPTCTQASTPAAGCIGSALASNFTNPSGGGSGPRAGVDFSTGPTWQVRVIDDVGGSNYYDDALATQSPAPCGCDLAGAAGGGADGAVWVRAQATVNGVTRALVELARIQSVPVQLPHSVLTAGWVKVVNNGKKILVDAQGVSNSVGAINVRCGSSAPSSGDSCLGWDPNKGQVSPSSAYQSSYTDPTGTSSVLTPSELNNLRQQAAAASPSTDYSSCPASLTGAVVVIENGNCSYSSGTYNSASSPGVLVVMNGSLSLAGNFKYYGLVYGVNGTGSPPPCTSTNENTVLSVTGTASIQGAVFIDGCGGMVVGASKRNLIFDANTLNSVTTWGTAAAVKNTFRELR